MAPPNASVGKEAIPRGQIRPGTQAVIIVVILTFVLFLAGPGYRARAPRPTAPPPAPAPASPKLQQLRMGDGSLMWALATGTEPMAGTNKTRTVFKVSLGLTCPLYSILNPVSSAGGGSSGARSASSPDSVQTSRSRPCDPAD